MDSQSKLKQKYFKKEKPKHGTKYERKLRYDIRRLIVKIMHQVWYVKTIETTNERDDLKVKDKIRVLYDCILKLI